MKLLLCLLLILFVVVLDLIARVKKISTARSSGDTPLHKCSRTGKFVSTVELLHEDTRTPL